LSRTDLVRYDREKVDYAHGVPEEGGAFDPEAPPSRWAEREGFLEVQVDRTRVREIMTPVVFTVKPETSAAEVVRQMLERKVHRLFVADAGGVLIAVISMSDILQHLQPEEPDPLFRCPGRGEEGRA
jgi:CBS domain-containing protein